MYFYTLNYELMIVRPPVMPIQNPLSTPVLFHPQKGLHPQFLNLHRKPLILFGEFAQQRRPHFLYPALHMTHP